MQRTLLPFLVLSAVPAFAASPVLNLILPRGAQRGTDVVLEFQGERMADAEEVLCYDGEIKITGLKAESPQKLVVNAHIEPTAQLGEHLFRVRTKTGLTYARTFWVGQFPTVDEKEPNTLFDQAQEINTGVTVHGVIDNEDVDYYKIQAKKGDRIGVELEGIRLGAINMDPYVGILNSKRFELATCDDSALCLQDPHASVLAPEDGTYFIEVRDSSYVGNGNYRYRLHVGAFPRPTTVYPAGGKAGTETEVTLLGDVAGPMKQKVAAPNTPGEKLKIYAQANNLSAPSANVFRVTTLDNVLETEPNNSFDETKGQATPPVLPMAFNGIIDKPADNDWFKFTAKKDQRFDFQVYARGIRSPLDPVLEIFNKDGGGINGNDDNGANPDSKIGGWVCPGDGEYYLRVRDHLARGGADFVYRVEVAPPQADLVAYITRQERNDSQLRQIIPVAKGNTYANLINVDRANCGGEVIFDNADLPPGVKLDYMPMPGNIGQYVIAFTAAADAPLGAKLTHMTPKLSDPKNPLSGRFVQNYEFVQGEPNNTPYYISSVNTLPVAVIDELPFTLEILKPTVPLVQSGNMDLKVVAKRKEGFKAPINVRMLWNPPGISSPGQVTIPENGTECIYPLNCSGGTEARLWKLAVTGDTDAGQGPTAASSSLQEVTVAPPYLSMKIEMGAVEQGKQGELLCKLEHAKPFQGKAKVTLYGLPAKATTVEKEIAAGDAEVRFPITTAPDTPAGKHTNLFCACIILENGVPVPHIIGQGGILRVDPPPPAPPPAPAAAPAAVAKAPTPAPATPAAKPLSRLEQLRQQSAQPGK